MTNDAGILSNIKSYDGSDSIFARNGESLKFSHVGDAEISTNLGKVPLNDVSVVP